MKTPLQLIYASLLLLLCAILCASADVEIVNPGAELTPTEKFLAACETNNFLACLKLFAQIEKSEHTDAVFSAVKHRNFWALQVLLNFGTFAEGHGQELVKYYMETQDMVEDPHVFRFIVDYAARQKSFNPDELFEIYFSKMPRNHNALEILLNRLHFDIGNFFIPACKAGNLHAVVLCTRRRGEISRSVLATGYTRAIEGRHARIVTYLRQNLGPKIITDARKGLKPEDEQWLDGLTQNHNLESSDTENTENTQSTLIEDFLTAHEQGSYLRRQELLPDILKCKHEDVVREAVKKGNPWAINEIVLVAERGRFNLHEIIKSSSEKSIWPPKPRV